MNITREQLKEIIREELQSLNEKTIKTGGIKIEMSVKGGHPLLRLYGHKGYVEAYGRKEIKAFVSALTKGFKIV